MQPIPPAPVPTRLQCLRLQRRMHMPMHIQNHCRQVCQVALALTNAGNSHWPMLDRALIQAAALLHDITKNRSFITGENHAATGENLLKKMGYARLGAIVGQHVKLRRANDSPAISEAHIINYADKRVLHDRIVSLDERMQYIMARYGHAPWQRQRLHAIWKETRGIESRIWAVTGHHPDDLPRLVEPA